jgi:hypothetical protein
MTDTPTNPGGEQQLPPPPEDAHETARAHGAEAAGLAVARIREDAARQHPEAPASRPVRPSWPARTTYRALLLLVVAAVAVPLYVAADLLSVATGSPVTRLDRLRERVDAVLNGLDARLGGEDAFAAELGLAAARVLDGFDRAVDWCISRGRA